MDKPPSTAQALGTLVGALGAAVQPIALIAAIIAAFAMFEDHQYLPGSICLAAVLLSTTIQSKG